MCTKWLANSHYAPASNNQCCKNCFKNWKSCRFKLWRRSNANLTSCRNSSEDLSTLNLSIISTWSAWGMSCLVPSSPGRSIGIVRRPRMDSGLASLLLKILAVSMSSGRRVSSSKDVEIWMLLLKRCKAGNMRVSRYKHKLSTHRNTLLCPLKRIRHLCIWACVRQNSSRATMSFANLILSLYPKMKALKRMPRSSRCWKRLSSNMI